MTEPSPSRTAAHTITPALESAAARSKASVPTMTEFAVVGSGWRSTFFLRLAYLMPDRFRVTGVVTRRESSGEAIEREWGIPTFRTIEELVRHERPAFVAPMVPWGVAPSLTRSLVAMDLPVLSETPPAPDLDQLRALWTDVGASGLVQVAEQYPLVPLHAARLAIARAGDIGQVTSVHVSSTHQYHAVALLRAFLSAEIGPTTVSAHRVIAPLIDPIDPTGWKHDATTQAASTTIAAIDFGSSRTGIYDFTDNQWWNPMRPDHLTVRGSHGEMHDEGVVRMVDEVTPVFSRIERSMTGLGMNFEGFDLTHLSFDGRPVFRNRFEGARLSDDEIAVAEIVESMGRWVATGVDAPYPLAEAIHDHHVSLAIEESATTGVPVETTPEQWRTA